MMVVYFNTTFKKNGTLNLQKLSPMLFASYTFFFNWLKSVTNWYDLNSRNIHFFSVFCLGRGWKEKCENISFVYLFILLTKLVQPQLNQYSPRNSHIQYIKNFITMFVYYYIKLFCSNLFFKGFADVELLEEILLKW